MQTYEQQTSSAEQIIKTSITFPVSGKVPKIKNWNNITEKIAHKDNENYGILTGKKNNLIIIDCDLLKTDDPNKYVSGVDAWNKLCEMYSFLKHLNIPTVQTLSGGIHLYFKYTDKLQSGIQKLNSNNIFFDNQDKTIKIDILSDNKFAVGPNGKDYKFIKNSQYCEIPEFPSNLIDIFNFRNRHNDPEKPQSVEKSTENIVSYSDLQTLVDKIPQEYSENYQEWIKIIWAISQTAHENNFDGLPIADLFSKKSDKYSGIEEVKQIYDQNNGKITVGTIFHILKENDLFKKNTSEKIDSQMLIQDINTHLTLPQEIKQLVSVQDEPSNKLCEFTTEDNQNLILKIYKDNLITTFHDNNFIGYLQSILNIKYDLSVVHPEFNENCNVVFIDRETIDFVSKEENKGEHRMRIKHPWDTKKRYYTKFSYGKQIGSMRRNKQELFVMIDEALRKACHNHLETKYNMTVNVQGNIIFNQISNNDESNVRSNEQFIRDLIKSHEGVLDVFKFCDNNSGSFNGVYLFGPNTGIWRKEHNGTIEKMLSFRLRNFVFGLTKQEIDYIESDVNIQKLRRMFIKEIIDPDFENVIDENRNVFATKNGVYDIRTKSFRNSVPEDYIFTHCGWKYDEQEADKCLPDVEKFFEQLFPIEEEHNVAVTFLASLIHGYRLDKKFIVLTDKRNGNNGKSTLIVLLRKFFGDYTKTSNKFLLKGSFDKDKDSHDGGLEPLKGKRILVCDELKKNMKLDEGLIKNLAGGEYTVEGRRLGKANQFKFVWQAGIVMIFNEGDCPKFDCTDNAFMERLVVVPMRSKFVVENEDPQTFTFKRDADIVDKFHSWRSSLLKFFIKFADKKGLTNMEIPQSMKEWKEEILSENNELKDWLFSVIQENEKGFVSLIDLKDKFRTAFPQERNLKNKDIERMINALFNSKGIYLKEQHKYYDSQGKRCNKKSVYLGYKFVD